MRLRNTGLAVVRHASARPDFLAIGHVTRDLLPDGSWRLGGAVTYAALTAARLGLRPPSSPARHPMCWRHSMPCCLIPLSVVPSAEATTFENIYTAQGRQQFLHGRAAPLTIHLCPKPGATPLSCCLGRWRRKLMPASWQLPACTGWRDATGLAASVGRGRRSCPIAAYQRRNTAAPSAGANSQPRRYWRVADTVFGEWARVVPLIAVTCSRDGAYVWEHGSKSGLFAGYPAHEVDPTGRRCLRGGLSLRVARDGECRQGD